MSSSSPMRPLPGMDAGDALRQLQAESGEISVFPLSFGEERLWFLDRLQESAVYNMLSAVRISGELDSGVLGAALEKIVRRHEILRTTFPTVEGSPVQLVKESVKIRLEE